MTSPESGRTGRLAAPSTGKGSFSVSPEGATPNVPEDPVDSSNETPAPPFEVVREPESVKAPGHGTHIHVEPMRLPASRIEPRFPFWIGTTSDSPLHNPVVGGVCFQTRSGTSDPVTGQPSGEPGCIVMLTERRVEFIREAVARKTIRKQGTMVMKLDASDPRYVPEDIDTPLAAYLYMVRLDPSAPNYRPPITPKPMWSPPPKAG